MAYENGPKGKDDVTQTATDTVISYLWDQLFKKCKQALIIIRVNTTSLFKHMKLHKREHTFRIWRLFFQLIILVHKILSTNLSSIIVPDQQTVTQRHSVYIHKGQQTKWLKLNILEALNVVFAGRIIINSKCSLSAYQRIDLSH